MVIGHFYMCRVYSTASLRGTLMFQLMQRAGMFFLFCRRSIALYGYQGGEIPNRK